MNKLTSCPYPK